MGRRSDQHNSGLRGMRPSDAGKQQEVTQQKGNTQESSKDAYYDGLPDHSSLHMVFLLLLLASQCSSVTWGHKIFHTLTAVLRKSESYVLKRLLSTLPISPGSLPLQCGSYVLLAQGLCLLELLQLGA
jgi:hypothetical protein